MTEALKPCPFCGNIPAVIAPLPQARETHHSPFCVWCSGCDTYHGYDRTFGGEFKTMDEAISSWNRRTPDD